MTQPEINRQNAQHSTGPRTANGKSVVSRNALSHGLFSRDYLLASEKEEEFAAFASRLYEHIAPVGAIEELLVEKLTWCAWRLKRLLAMEKMVFDHPARIVVEPESQTPSWQRMLTEGGLAFCDLTRIGADAEERGLCEEEIYARYLANMRQSNGGEIRGKEPLQLLARYEANLERNFHRALHELQRVQALRSGIGGAMPVALDVNFTTANN